MKRREFITLLQGLPTRFCVEQRQRNLPIQQPVKFDFFINLKTAKALGLNILETSALMR